MKEEDDASLADGAPPAPGTQPTGTIQGPATTAQPHATTTTTTSRPAA
jgi:hypothetical protein